MNHDCRPNAHYYFDTKSMTHHVHAVRTIHTGEELTISYIDPAQPRLDRLKRIKKSWGFDCACSLCTQRDIFTKESDKRINLIANLETSLADWSNDSLATPEMAEALISLYEQERMYAPIAVAYTYAAMAYNAVGKVHEAFKWASLAVETGLLYSGPYYQDVIEMKTLMRNPQSHWSFLARLKDD
jgi:SET domain